MLLLLQFFELAAFQLSVQCQETKFSYDAKIGELLHEGLYKNYCMKLHQIKHFKLLLPQKVICIPCILPFEAFVPILPLAVSPSILPSSVIVSELLWMVICFPFFLNPCILLSKALLSILPFRVINFRILWKAIITY